MWSGISYTKITVTEQSMKTYFIKDLCTVMKTHLHGFWNIIQVPLSAHTENLNICYKQFGLHTHQATKVQRFGRLSEWNHRKLVPDSIKTKTPSPSLLITQGCDGVTGRVLIGGDPLHVIIKETHRRMNMVLHRHRSIPPPKLKDYLKNSRFHSKTRRNKEGVCAPAGCGGNTHSDGFRAFLLKLGHKCFYVPEYWPRR